MKKYGFVRSLGGRKRRIKFAGLSKYDTFGAFWTGYGPTEMNKYTKAINSIPMWSLILTSLSAKHAEQ